jgi:hypothetical protein
VRTFDSVRWLWTGAAAIVAIAGCASTVQAPVPQNADTGGAPIASTALARPAGIVPHATRDDAASRPWVDAGAARPLVYVADATANTVTVLNSAGTLLLDVIGGLNTPNGLFVDTQHRLWVANEDANDVLVFDRNKRKASLTLSDTGELPVDVTVCPNGTAYVSNLATVNNGQGNIAVYAAGSTSPTGHLTYPGQGANFFVTCDPAGNVFTTLFFDPGRNSAGVVEYPGGAQTGAMSIGVVLQFPGGIKTDPAGNLLVDDQLAHDVAEYTEAGKATGKMFIYGASSDWSDIAMTGDGKLLAGADAILNQVTEVGWPHGQGRRIYRSPVGPDGNFTTGIAFDPGQKGSQP